MCPPDKNLINVSILAASFMLLFASFQAISNLEKVIFENIREEGGDYKGNGYISLGIVYLMMSLCNWMIPFLITLISPNFTILFGGILYVLYAMSMLLPSHTWVLYFASAIFGFGAAAVCTAQAVYLTMNSTSSTVIRNSVALWGILQLSTFVANIFLYFQLQHAKRITSKSSDIIWWTLAGIAGVGIFGTCFLPSIKKDDRNQHQLTFKNNIETVKVAKKLFMTRNMFLFCIVFFYTGLEWGFLSGVYPACLAFTEHFKYSKELIGISGIFTGLGETAGGIIGMLTLNKLNPALLVIAACIMQCSCYIFIALNLPSTSPFGETEDESIIKSTEQIAIVCSFLLGMGDSVFNTQLYALLNSVYPSDIISITIIFKFVQGFGSAVSLFYSSYLILYGQMGILFLFLLAGTIAFVCLVDKFKKQESGDSVSVSRIIYQS